MAISIDLTKLEKRRVEIFLEIAEERLKQACFPPDPYIIFDRKAETLWREIIMGGSFGGCYWGDYVNRLHVLLSF